MDLQLKNKVALVFGASQGLGRAIAQSLANEGAHVFIASRQLEKLKVVATEIKGNQSGGVQTSQNVETVVCDLSVAGQAKAAVNEVLKKAGRLDIVVMNTGGPQKGSFDAITLNQWQNDFQNLWLSLVDATQSALPHMKENNYGRFLFVTSLAAKEPLAGLTTSNGLRAGISGLAKSLANEVAAHGVTVNCLLPGYTDTERLRELNLPEEKVRQLVPAGRLGHPRELADLATFLASPRAGYITDLSIAVDGGALRGW